MVFEVYEVKKWRWSLLIRRRYTVYIKKHSCYASNELYFNRCRLQKCIFASIFFFCLFYASSNSLFAAAPIKALLKWESLKRSYIHFVRDSLPFHNFVSLLYCGSQNFQSWQHWPAESSSLWPESKYLHRIREWHKEW